VILPRYETRTPPRVGNDIPSRCFDSTTRHLEGSVRTSAQMGEAITRPERARSNGPHASGQHRCFRRVSLWDGLPALGAGSYESPGARLSRRVLRQARTTPQQTILIRAPRMPVRTGTHGQPGVVADSISLTVHKNASQLTMRDGPLLCKAVLRHRLVMRSNQGPARICQSHTLPPLRTYQLTLPARGARCKLRTFCGGQTW
jgi:hypothetical protein